MKATSAERDDALEASLSCFAADKIATTIQSVLVRVDPYPTNSHRSYLRLLLQTDTHTHTHTLCDTHTHIVVNFLQGAGCPKPLGLGHGISFRS